MKNTHNSENKVLQNSEPSLNTTKSTASVEASSSEQAISETRRAFILKYGALAAITPVALTLTMQSGKALASSCTECGP